MPVNRSAVFQSTIIHVVNYSYDEIAARTINRLLLHGDVFLTALGRYCWRRGVVVSGVRRMNEIN